MNFWANLILTLLLLAVCATIIYVLFRPVLEPIVQRYIPLRVFNRDDYEPLA
ncbi:hypothetical protein TRVA0_021S01442 [Trichomonascus vanleenenianus]|uniref:uncharacterized protein n=1 Tax=Trichomonascus vanleenenianus TaxID=2268995 RepID=UPI003EC99ED9